VTTNPCNGDVVTFAGLSHTVTVLNGNQVTIQENWPDTSGVAVDETTYQVNDANHVFVRSVPGGAFTLTLSDSFEFVSNDGSSNFLVHMGIEVSFPSGDTDVRGAGEECSGPTPYPPTP
jgi:hypothetical protein